MVQRIDEVTMTTQRDGQEIETNHRLTRRQLVGKGDEILAATALASVAVGMFAPLGSAFAADTAASGGGMTPEVKLVDDYNNWYAPVFSDPEKLRAGLPNYITAETILHEAASLPWGGTMVGYDGWVSLCNRSKAIWEPLLPYLDISSPTYYQNRNVVMHEFTLTIKPTKEAPTPFVMGIVEKYTVRNGKIVQIDEFYADTASFLERLALLRILPARHPG